MIIIFVFIVQSDINGLIDGPQLLIPGSCFDYERPRKIHPLIRPYFKVGMCPGFFILQTKCV